MEKLPLKWFKNIFKIVERWERNKIPKYELPHKNNVYIFGLLMKNEICILCSHMETSKLKVFYIRNWP